MAPEKVVWRKQAYSDLSGVRLTDSVQVEMTFRPDGRRWRAMWRFQARDRRREGQNCSTWNIFIIMYLAAILLLN